MPARAARLLFQLPRECRVFNAIDPQNQWGWSEILANKANYLLEILIWQNSKDGQKKAPRYKPKPFVPDFLKKTSKPGPINNGSELHTTDDIRSILSLPRG